MNKISSFSVLESTLQMYGAEKYLPEFKKYGIDTKTLALLTEEDLIAIGVDDVNLRNKIVKQVKNLPKENIVPLQIDEEYISIVLKDIEQHLKVLHACLSVCVMKQNVNISDVKLTKGVTVLQNCIDSFSKEFEGFQNKLIPNKKNNRFKKWKYFLPFVITASASVYAFKKYLNS